MVPRIGLKIRLINASQCAKPPIAQISIAQNSNVKPQKML